MFVPWCAPSNSATGIVRRSVKVNRSVTIFLSPVQHEKMIRTAGGHWKSAGGATIDKPDLSAVVLTSGTGMIERDQSGPYSLREIAEKIDHLLSLDRIGGQFPQHRFPRPRAGQFKRHRQTSTM